jgi:hypothetical protein
VDEADLALAAAPSLDFDWGSETLGVLEGGGGLGGSDPASRRSGNSFRSLQSQHVAIDMCWRLRYGVVYKLSTGVQ